jgi:nicotinamidase-related amidase
MADRDSDADSLTGQLRRAMPIRLERLALGAERTGLVIVDEIHGFATVGAGPLAPPAEEPTIRRMVAETDRLARDFSQRHWPILAFLDTHEPGKPEPPYPAHCEAGSGHEHLVPELAWLEHDPHTALVRKDCINGFIGAIQPDGHNRLVHWVNHNRLQALLVVGICTDICVMDFVLTLLSARNHDMMPGLADILVYEPGCATYNLPRETAEQIGLGPAAAHPREATHYMGLYFMASRGARLVDAVTVAA